MSGVDRGTEGADTPGFRVIDARALTHLDALAATDTPMNPVPAGIETFLREHTADGTVAVPAR
jgi:hypothetical protein